MYMLYHLCDDFVPLAVWGYGRLCSFPSAQSRVCGVCVCATVAAPMALMADICTRDANVYVFFLFFFSGQHKRVSPMCAQLWIEYNVCSGENARVLAVRLRHAFSLGKCDVKWRARARPQEQQRPIDTRALHTFGSVCNLATGWDLLNLSTTNCLLTLNWVDLELSERLYF